MVDTRKSLEDKDLCSKVGKFVELYRESLDNRRDRISTLYSFGQPVSLTWNGHHITDVGLIQTFLNELPATKHTLTSIDPQLINVPGHTGWAVVSIVGRVVIGNAHHGFTRCLVLVPEDNGYHIRDDQFRFFD